jgi:hypothetical protein
LALFLASISVCAAADEEFTDSKVIDVQARQGISNGVLGGLDSDPHTEVTIAVGDKKVTARTFAIGGGTVYLANHPEAMMVGATVKARIAKRGELHVEAADGKVLKFKIQRLEQL